LLNEHNTVFARSGTLYAIGLSLGPPVLNANGISIASEFSTGLPTLDRLTDRPTDHATWSFTVGGIYLHSKGKEQW